MIFQSFINHIQLLKRHNQDNKCKQVEMEDIQREEPILIQKKDRHLCIMIKLKKIKQHLPMLTNK